jgi:hypothetical protein
MSNKEIDELRKRQEIAKAAELKAKLDMVELRDKQTYGRPPRKIGEMICDTGIKKGHRQETAKFVLRLDEKAGDFIAEHGDFMYVSKSREALQAKMDEVARITLDLKWTRYLRVEYKAEVPYYNTWQSTTTLDVDDDRKKKPIFGMTLVWEVVDYSDSFRLPGDDEDRYMCRDVDEDGNASSTQETVKTLPPGLVPHTKEREDLFKSIREAFNSIDKKMCELLKGSPAQVAKRLDAVQGPLLLTTPKEKR